MIRREACALGVALVLFGGSGAVRAGEANFAVRDRDLRMTDRVFLFLASASQAGCELGSLRDGTK